MKNFMTMVIIIIKYIHVVNDRDVPYLISGTVMELSAMLVARIT